MKYKKNKYGSIILDDGTTTTKKEQKAIKNRVQKTNRKREKMLTEMYEGAKNNNILKGISKEAYAEELDRRGLIPKKQSASMQNIKNKKDKQRKLSNLNKLANTNYNENKYKQLKKKLYNQLDSRLSRNTARKIKNKLGKLTKSQLVALYLYDNDFTREIFYWSGEDEEQFEEYTETRINLALKAIGG